MNLENSFFIGIAGSGMSALAQYLALQGHAVSGSDRSLEAFLKSSKSKIFTKLNIHLFAQDGSGLNDRNTCIIRSTAIEDDHPEIVKARELGIPLYSRSELLASLVNSKKSIAVAGTSGKSSVTAMLFNILKSAKLDPSILTGAGLLDFLEAGNPGNAHAGGGEWLVFEADESDGSLVNYRPDSGIMLNIQKDHKEISELVPLFRTFCENVKNTLVFNGDDVICSQLTAETEKPAVSFSKLSLTTQGGASHPIENIVLEDWRSSFTLSGVPFELNVPGLHNISNATAAIGAALGNNISLESCAEGLRNYPGIERRLNLIGIKNNITVVDDFAHNPEKIRACLNTLKNIRQNNGNRGRILAVFQPHGFAPLKLMRRELVSVLSETLGEEDKIYLPEIYYAGGTADKSISSRQVVEDIRKTKNLGDYFPDKGAVLEELKNQLQKDDIIVSMGARDPGLADFARQIYDLIP